jgi:hypothetical protein
MKGMRIAMTLHHHTHYFLQNNLWCSMTKVIVTLKFFSTRSCRHPFQHGRLMQTSLVPMILLSPCTRSGVRLPLLSSCTISGASSASATETVGAKEFTAEGGKTSALASSSSCTSSSLSELLRSMMLSSPGSPRSLQLRSPKCFPMNSSSHKVSGKASYSSKERSTTGIPSEGLPCSYTGDDVL